MRRAVFLDRDGVINRERRDYVRTWSQFEFLPRALPALATLERSGLAAIVVTNQSAVGRGLIPEQQLAGIHDRMCAHVSAAGGHIAAVYACVHAPSADCGCRKPGIELFTRAAAELRIDLEESVMVGDSLTDVQAARTAGCLPILAGRPAPADGPGDLIVVEDLAQAVDRILSLVSSSPRTAGGGRWGADPVGPVSRC